MDKKQINFLDNVKKRNLKPCQNCSKRGFVTMRANVPVQQDLGETIVQEQCPECLGKGYKLKSS